MSHEQNFLELVNQALRIAHSAKRLDHIISGHYLVGFDSAPGLFVIARERSTPRELAVQLAIRQIEADAFACFSTGFQAKAERAKHVGHLQ